MAWSWTKAPERRPSRPPSGPARPALPAGPRPDDDKEWWRALVRAVFARMRPSPAARPAFNALFEDLYAHFAQPGVWEVYPDVRPALEELRAPPAGWA